MVSFILRPGQIVKPAFPRLQNGIWPGPKEIFLIDLLFLSHAISFNVCWHFGAKQAIQL
ncbi:hypothetical protein Pan161_42100 [Gimesia algae]|uniref:Uncharacterized protein n=1 Tax=Gimesia algae TaxID=2527971 RepID=A0A517VHV0_9PLAN|nr:hypothetical protein Pan161_42100 [Gimesia algae]